MALVSCISASCACSLCSSGAIWCWSRCIRVRSSTWSPEASVARVLTRRRFIVGAAAASLLAGCERRPVMGFLGAIKSWNEKFEGFVFSPNRLAPELPPSAETPENAFPAYFISDEMPPVPVKWGLKVGGLAQRPAGPTLAQPTAPPAPDRGLPPHCLDGWTAVAS